MSHRQIGARGAFRHPTDPQGGTRTTHGEQGGALVEFLGGMVVLLVPLVYLVLTLSQVQAAAFAAEGAAREAGRHLATAPSMEQGLRSAQIAVVTAFADHGLVVDASHALDVHCLADPCLEPGAHLGIDVGIEVPLPVPDFLSGAVPVAVPVNASHVVAVPELRGAR
ncbi:pilus assembly protein [Bogoriella caseilytica]|uniref:pilus assembly protein n=1 Tax=Bogoriella caseilytica TaxID=56055 RepID=UPI001FE50C1A|nr:pilus assembly protein [Bogoriella caseilytica]